MGDEARSKPILRSRSSAEKETMKSLEDEDGWESYDSSTKRILVPPTDWFIELVKKATADSEWDMSTFPKCSVGAHYIKYDLGNKYIIHEHRDNEAKKATMLIYLSR